MSTNVWNRAAGSEAETLPRRVFYGVLSLWTTLGIVAAAVAAYMTKDAHFGWPAFIGLFLVAIVSVFGTTAAARANNVMLTTICYFGIAAPMGMMMGPAIAHYTTASVASIFVVTASLTIGLGLLGVFIPRSLENWGSWLFGALWILIISQFVGIIAAMFGFPIGNTAFHLFDWIGVALFGGFIIFDFNRAARVPSTYTNAMLCAVEIFLDFINLFIRLLDLFGFGKVVG